MNPFSDFTSTVMVKSYSPEAACTACCSSEPYPGKENTQTQSSSMPVKSSFVFPMISFQYVTQTVSSCVSMCVFYK